MKSIKEQLLDQNFEESFTPEITDEGKWREFHSETRGKIGYLYSETPHEKGLCKKFVFTVYKEGGYTCLQEYPEKITKRELKQLTEIEAQERHRISEMLEARYKRTALEAAEIVKKAVAPTVAPPYLQSRGLTTLKGYVVASDNPYTMIIPLYEHSSDTGPRVVSLQYIYTDGSKQFPDGYKMQGCYGVIEGGLETLYVCEGFSTAASIHEATKQTVAFVLSSTNYEHATKNIFSRFHPKYRVICADDDRHLEENTGWNKAFAIAKKFSCAIKKPAFKKYDGKNTTDFDDLRRLEGIEVLKAQIELSEQEKDEYSRLDCLFPLGQKDSEFYFTSTKNPDTLSFSTLDKSALFKLMPIEWWEEHYGEVSATGNIVIPYDRVFSDLYESCRVKGIFEYNRIRGVGVYLDGAKTVIHCGDSLIVDGKKTHIRAFPSHYHYSYSAPMNPPEAVGLNDSELAPLNELFRNLNLKDPNSKTYIAGWMVCAIIAGALSWRPHLYITGKRGSGKTVFMEFMNSFLNKAFMSRMFEAVESTPAGLRQALKSAAVPIFLDEVESDAKKTANKIADFINLYRVASGNSNTSTVLGSSSQKAVEYNVSFCGVMAGIVPQLKEDQDKSRFAMIEFETREDPIEQARRWKIVEKLIGECTKEEYARKFGARVIKNLSTILENIKIVSEGFGSIAQPRAAQQFGALFAASLIFKHTNKVTPEELEEFKQKYLIGDLTIEKSTEMTGESDLLDAILDMDIFDDENKRSTVRSEIVREEIAPRVKDILAIHGVVPTKHNGDDGVVILKSSKIRKALSELPMYRDNYMTVLKRNKDFTPNVQVWSQKKRKRGIFIPVNCYMDKDDTKKKDVQF